MRVRKPLFLAVICLGLVASLSVLVSHHFLQPVTFRGHSGRILSAFASPDGRFLATVSEDKTLKWWDVASRRERATFPAQTGQTVAFGPKGKTLATAGEGANAIQLRNLATGKLTATIRGHVGQVYSLAFSPDGKTLVSGGGETTQLTIQFWDVASGKNTQALRDDDKILPWPTSLAFSPDGKVLASGHWMAVKLWDVGTGRRTAALDGHNDEYVDSVAFSPDGQTLASAGAEGEINLWEVASGKNIATIDERYPRQPRPRLLRYLQSVADAHPDFPFPLPGLIAKRTLVPLSVYFTREGRLMALGHDGRDNTVMKMWQVAAAPGGQN